MTLLVRPARLVLAVSGGSDSVGLLMTFADHVKALPDRDVDLVVATIDHALRPASAQEALDVGLLCAELGIPHVIRRWEGDKPKSGISAAAREARYRLLMEIADTVGADAIVTGHTADDQAETIAMRASRNASPDNRGLSGMAEAVLVDGRRWLLRPFLSTPRADIRRMLTEKGRGWIDDPSNEDRHYERVRMRQALALPAGLAADGMAGAETDCDRGEGGNRDNGAGETGAVDAMARRASLSDKAAELAERHLTILHGVLARFDIAGLNAEPDVRRHLFSVLAAVLGGQPHLMAARTVTRVSAFVDGGLAGRITAGRVIFDRRRDALYLQRESRDLPMISLEAGEAALWDGRYRIHNLSSASVTVGPGVAERAVAMAEFPDVPPAIAMRAVAVMPSIEGKNEHIRVRPVLQPFDRFLPLFDLKLAGTLAELIGCDVFVAPPIKLSARKS